jgi:tetratricopeptide (TPR) repeat protein
MKLKVQSSLPQLRSADSLFREGLFSEAGKIYSKVLEKDPENFQSILRLGHIALLSNYLDDAQKWLTQAAELKPKELAQKSLLAEAFYRHDNFQRAVPLLRGLGREAIAKKLESFKDVAPYHIQEKANSTCLKFVMTDPLPVVQVRVNDSKPVNFFIDTGGAEVIVDTNLAQEVGAAQFGSETGTFAGGKQAGFQHGRIDFLTAGGFTVKNVPVHIMDVRRFSPIFGGTPVDGIIGTVFLYHFIATLDYPEGQLILRLKTDQNLKQIEQEAKRRASTVVPFWMAGDHYMVAWGTVNKSQPMLFFVDTGLAGGGFMCPESTLLKAVSTCTKTNRRKDLVEGGKLKSFRSLLRS